MRRILAAGFLLLASLGTSYAQTSPGTTVQGTVINRATVNSSVTITTGNTFQQALASTLGTTTQRQSLTIQNNNTSTDNCWVFFGATASATKATSALLQPGQAYTRYWPFVPSDAIQVTCASTNDTMYVENQ